MKQKSRVIYIILACTIGLLGAHNFYSGHRYRGFVKLGITVLTFWVVLPLIPVYIWVLVEIFTTGKDASGIEMVI